MGSGAQKLWLIILLGERQDEKSTPKMHEIEKDLNESILSRQRENHRKHAGECGEFSDLAINR